MSRERTPEWVCQLRFYAICMPVGIIAAIALLPFAVPMLLGFGVTLVIFWNFTRLFTNGVVRVADPETYKVMRRGGVEPFVASLGAPLNFDSEEVRLRGLTHNASCPACADLLWINPGLTLTCPGCGACWHNDQWWKWNGSQWILIQ